MTYLKQKDRPAPKKRESNKPAQPPAMDRTKVIITGPMSDHNNHPRSIQHDINYVAGMDGIEGSLDNLVGAVARLTHDDHNVGVTVCQNQYGGPVNLALTDTDGNDTMDRLVTAFERIADSVAKL